MQTQSNLHTEIRRASNRKILRRQVELLAEYSRLFIGVESIPECSLAMAKLYPELIKAERIAIVRFLVLIGVLFGLLYGFYVKFVKLFKRK